MDAGALTIRAVGAAGFAVVLAGALGAQEPAPGTIPPGSLATTTIMWRLHDGCAAGGLAACDTLAMYHFSVREKGNRKYAVGVWQRACEAGGVGACANLAFVYDEGDLVDRDRKRAFSLASAACDSGSAPGCVAVGMMLEEGRVGKKDQAAGSAMMERACGMHDLYGCMLMAARALEGQHGEPRDSARAFTYFDHACRVAVADHPYRSYRYLADAACKMAKDLSSAVHR